ncbi:hypothetical protein ACRARG_16085 [Pseudooceanicola sp. C21-150M6]|uniref:hypothetical protein n=1 Tax=Pseudooceanicola sp. C21-150M6 TaxID=3434355 RepID=UPI003D7F3B1D
MAESNKILTVSYGTFSCTLEGFDDAFTTMKAIAEYFRDLAADDRFFGAEPPQPDPELLARLASRASARRVEARSGDDGIVLRTDDRADMAAARPALAVTRTSDAQAPKSQAPETLADTAEDEVEDETVLDALAADVQPDAAEPADAPVPPATPDVAEAEAAVDAPEADVADDDDAAVAALDVQEEAAASEADVADADDEPAMDPVPLAEAGTVVAEPDEDTEVDAAETAAALPEDEAPAEAPYARSAAPRVTRPTVRAKVGGRAVRVGSGRAVSVSQPVRTPAPKPEGSPAPHPDSTSVAAKLQRIRDVVSKAPVAPMPDFTEDEHAVDARTARRALAPETDADDAFTEASIAPAPEPWQDRVLGDATETEADAAPEAGFDLADADADDDADDAEIDLSAELAIANASDDEDAIEADAQTEGDWTAEALAEFTAADASELELAAERDAEAEEDAEEGWDEDAYEVDEDAAFAELDAEEADASDAGWESWEDEDEPVAPPAAEKPVARVLKVKRRDFDAAIENELLEEDLSDQADLEAPRDLGATSLSPEDEAALQSELSALEAEIARDSSLADVDKPDDFDALDDAEDMADLEAMDDLDDAEDAEEWDDQDDFDDIEAFDEADEEDDDDLAPRPAAQGRGDIEDDEDEAEADREDASFLNAFADLDDDDDDEDDTDGEESVAAAYAAEDPQHRVVARRRRLLDAGSDDDMDRILAETDQHLSDTDSTRRRTAIAHLRAAVAATQAEKQAGSDLTSGADEGADAYREDLAQVVRPRRPGGAPGMTRRDEDRPAPLKLIAEQRVDLGGSPAGTVKPRRIRVADLAQREEVAEAPAPRHHDAEDMEHHAEQHARAAAANAASFEEFAERVGASSLPDLLEAAASYMAFVEERDQFSRPQLMNKIRQIEGDSFSREDSLRHFGQLLREGKLRRLQGGRFAVSDRISFRPESRAAS